MNSCFNSRNVFGLLVLAAAGPSVAAGFQLLEQNSSGLGNAYAGSAVAEDASVIFYNPAAMTQLQSNEISLGSTFVRPSFRFSNENSNSGRLSGNGGDAGGWNAVPNAYGAMALNDSLRLGLGFSTPFGLKTEYPDPWIGAAQSLEFDIKTYNVNPSLAWKANDQLSLGLGVSAQKMDAQYTRVAGIGAAGPGSVFPATLLTLKADDISWGWNAGILISPDQNTRIGLSYRSQVRHRLTGDINANGPSAALNAQAKGSVEADINLPDTWVLSFSHQLDTNWEVLADVMRTGWSSVPKIDIVYTSGVQQGKIGQTLITDFRDSWRVALGASYSVNESWKIKSGIAWDQTPVKSAEYRMVSMPDNDRYWVSLGTQYKPNKSSRFDIGAAYLFIRDSKVNNYQGTTFRDHGLVNGSYTGNVLVVGTQYSQSF